jgi:hypothetical protein
VATSSLRRLGHAVAVPSLRVLFRFRNSASGLVVAFFSASTLGSGEIAREVAGDDQEGLHDEVLIDRVAGASVDPYMLVT